MPGAARPTALSLEEVTEYLKQHEQKQLLRFVAVGSVDDGKSTLIGRLLHDTHGIYEDQLAAVERASKTRGSTGGKLDLALLTDGLKAEREQGITIDVAYRYFSTDRRKFIIADTPGHVQYTRNMATGASTADVALILVDARLGVLQQSRRHAYIASLLGIPHLAVCVNKMDLVSFDQERYAAIVAEFSTMLRELRFREVRFFPISAVDGDNIVHPSARAAWHDGGTLLGYLEDVPVEADQNHEILRFPVQYVLRPDLTYRGFCGQVASGVVAAGDEIVVLPSGRRSRVASIDTFDGPIAEAFPPMSVTLRLEDEIDISRGDMLVHPEALPSRAQRLEAHVVWMGETPLDVSGSYFVKHTTRMVRASVERVVGRLNLDDLAEEPAETLALNDIGRVVVSLNQPIYVDPYVDNRSVGAFVLIDALTNNTVGAGMVIGALEAERAEGVLGLTASGLGPGERSARLGHGPVVIGFGSWSEEGAAAQLSMARSIERRLFELGLLPAMIDVAKLSDPTRSAALVADVAEHFVATGLVTILSTGLPRAAQREDLARRLGPDLVLVPENVTDRRERLDAWVTELLRRRGFAPS